jgi:hypothetical protein
MTSQITPNPLYQPIRKGERTVMLRVHPNIVPMVLTVRDARGCTVRGAHELLVRTGFAVLLKHGFLDTVPKDDWLGIVCDALGIDVKTLLKRIRNEADKSLANPPRQ